MSVSRFPLRAAAGALSTACVLALLGACSGDVNPMREAALGLGSGVKPLPAPDFVAESRPADKAFMPVGVSAPKRSVRAKSAESQKALEAELEGARGRNESKGRAAEGVAKAQAPALKPNVPPSE